MVGKIFGGLVAVMIATASVWAGKLNIAVVHSVDVVAELYVIEALCPSLKIDHDAFARTASLNLMSTETLQSVLVEGRRRSADEARRLTDFRRRRSVNTGGRSTARTGPGI